MMKAFPSTQGELYLGTIKDGLKTVLHNLSPTSVSLIADENTARLCAPLLIPIIGANHLIVIPAGGAFKNLDSCRQIWSSLIRNGADRGSLVLNVGGGMICDLGGFSACCYQRGIRFGHIPTSVLAMADAAIGGKTGIDYEGFKNYLGRIEPPSFTWIDPVFIQTLPFREIKNGFTEIVKHAIVGSPSLWEMLSGFENLEGIDWITLFEKNIPVKQGIVDADPNESGLRKVLNFGHTIGHAFESHFLQTEDPISHGEAITLGLLCESRIACEMGLLGNEDFQSIITLIHRLLSPVGVTLPSSSDLQHWIKRDKKSRSGLVGFSLPDQIGSCGWNIHVKESLIEESFSWLATQVKAPSDRLNMGNKTD